MMNDLLNNPMVMAFGWTLVHSLWLALSLALIVRIAQHFISSDRAVLRYRMGLVAMLILLAGSALVFTHYFQVYEALAALAALPETTEATLTTIMEFDALGVPEVPVAAGFTMEYFIQQMESYFPFLVAAWLVGALMMGLRLAGSWMYLNNLGKKGIQTPTDEWNLLFRDLCTKMGIQRPVQFFISDRVQEPITLRHLKPIVLFPIGLVTQLSIEQVEVVLLHELAHIKRWDYLVNWLQSLLELLFFYHPAVWWLSGQVRTAREHCCDDLVLQAGNQQKMLYAQTLTQVSAYSLNSKSKLAMSLSGKNNNSFTFRVKRLFGQVDQRFDWQKSMISGLLVLFVVLVALFNTSALFADENEPLNTELWDLINDEVSQMELEDEFILESIAETDPDPSDNPKREPMIMINRKFVGYGAAGKAKLDPNIEYKAYEFMAEWAMLDFGERARWGAINYVTSDAQIEKDALIEGSKNLFGLKDTDLLKQDTTPLYILDGVIMEKDVNIDDIDPQNIASVTVLKDKSATALYGSKGANGVVVITTKNGLKQAKEDKPSVVVVGRATEAISERPLIVIDGVKKGFGKEKISNLKPDDIATINVLKGDSAAKAYGDDGKNGVIEVVTKAGAKKEKTLKGVLNEARSSFKIKDTSKEPLIKNDDGKMFEGKLIFVDGVKSKVGEPLVDNLYTEDIKTISISKGEAALKRYGEEGKTGVIEIVTKAASDDTPNEVKKGAVIKSAYFHTDATTKGNPLVVVNGKNIGNSQSVEELNIDPKDIKKIDVLKDKSAIAIYGDAGKDGVILIELKNGAAFEMPKENAEGNTTIRIRGKTAKDPLYVIDGKVVGKGDKGFLSIEPEDIKAINVLKGEAAFKKYGEEGEDGVVEITMKENTAHQYRAVPTPKKVVPELEIIRKPGESLAKTKFLYGEYKGAMMRKMNPLIIFDDQVMGKKSKVEKLIKTEDIGHIAYGGPLQRDLEKYGAQAKDGVAYISRQVNIKADEIVVNGHVEESTLDNYMVFINGKREGLMKDVKGRLDKTNVKSFTVYGKNQLPAKYKNEKQAIILIKTKGGDDGIKDDVALRVDFKGKTRIEDKDGKTETYEVGKMSIEMSNLKEVDKKKASHLRFSSNDGIDIKAYLSDNANHPLLILDGVQMKAGDSRIQNLDPASVKSIELIEGGPALLPYGDAAKYGVMKINTKPIVVAGKEVLPQMENGMEIGDQLEDSKFWFGPKGNTKQVDPLVVVDGIAKGYHSKVSKNYTKEAVATVVFSGPTADLTKQFGSRAKDGVVFIDTKEAIKKAEQVKLAVPSFQKDLEASLKVFPNPFGKETRINFNLPEAARTKVSVFNAQGQLVKVLQDAQLQAGLHQVDWNSERSPSGNYTVVIESLNTRITKTIIKQ